MLYITKYMFFISATIFGVVTRRQHRWSLKTQDIIYVAKNQKGQRAVKHDTF